VEKVSTAEKEKNKPPTNKVPSEAKSRAETSSVGESLIPIQVELEIDQIATLFVVMRPALLNFPPT